MAQARAISAGALGWSAAFGIGRGGVAGVAGVDSVDKGMGCSQGFQRLSSKAFDITLTELRAIAAPANTGFR